MRFQSALPQVRKKAVWGRSLLLTVFAALFAIPAAAQSTDVTSKFDDAVREAWKTGSFSRVIIRFANEAERDRAFDELLDRGAAVRKMDDELSPSLNVYSSPAALSTVDYASRISYDAPVTLSAATLTAAQKAAAEKAAAAAAAVKAAAEKAAAALKAAQLAAAQKAAAKAAAKAAVPPPPFDAVLQAQLASKAYNQRGTGVTVAVIDSGFKAHPDIAPARVLAYKDFVTGGSTLADGCGHGTHVAGIVGGSGIASQQGFKGVAPQANFVIVRVLGDDCSGKTSDVIDALNWVLKNRERYGIKVVNLSLGHPVFEPSSTDPMVQAVEKLATRGVAVVTAAGNMGINEKSGKVGYGGVGVPCNAPRAICVGAGDTKGTPGFDDDRVADYSSRGPSRFDMLSKPDVVATGHKVTSLAAPGSFLFKNYPGLQVYGGYEAKTTPAQYLTLSGTSMASPMVAGAAAAMLEFNPELSANAMKMIMQYTARTMPGVDTLTQGAGYLNLAGAELFASAMRPNAKNGARWVRKGAVLGSNEDANGQTIAWGKRIIYGDRFILGDAAYTHMYRWDDNVVWGMDSLVDNIVWGNCADGCDNIVWGNYWDELENVVWGNFEDNIVWGNKIVMGENDVWGYCEENVVWGFWDDNIVWGNVNKYDQDNIVWGNDWMDNVVWGNSTDDENIVWGNNIVWGFTSLSVLTGGGR